MNYDCVIIIIIQVFQMFYICLRETRVNINVLSLYEHWFMNILLCKNSYQNNHTPFHDKMLKRLVVIKQASLLYPVIWSSPPVS
uniref:Uncharacterized protein n=1 Tax=Timema shepardi TaxID=629360 RepID=A0A7R9G8Q5_TIMSH|nr:unnamed protein product [Timema shepardi]